MFFENSDICFDILNVFRVKREAQVSINRNRSWSGIAYRISGSTVFLSKEEQHIAETGSISYVPAWVDYERHSTEEEIIIIHFNSYPENSKKIEILNPEDAERFSEYFTRLAKEWEEHTLGYKNRCMSIFYKLLEELQLNENTKVFNKKEQIIKKSISYMNSNYDNSEISLAQIAGQSNISEVYFRKLYKELYGISPMEAIINMRIRKAKDLLVSGYFSVMEVSEKSGFRSVKYFSTLFKNKTGASPSDLKPKI